MQTSLPARSRVDPCAVDVALEMNDYVITMILSWFRVDIHMNMPPVRYKFDEFI